MAPKTKVEEKADQAKQIADAVEQAVAAWSPLVALAIRGVRLMVRKNRGEDTAADEAKFEADCVASEGLLDGMEARGADYRARRAAETATPAGE